jgi:DNA-binding HxlR family transcriptional regulator
MIEIDRKYALPGNLSVGVPEREETCARFEATQGLKRLARVWTTPVMLLLLDGPLRFAQLERELAPISAKVLAQRLQELEREGHVTRTEIVSTPPKTVEYRLSPLGESIRPVLEALANWERNVRTKDVDFEA